MKDFFNEFRNDHRQIRDLILNLVGAFIQNDMEQAATLIIKLSIVAGPHFKFEEEVLYPELIPVYGPQYINKLYIDHDLVIARIRKLIEFIGNGQVNEKECNAAIDLLEGLLPHLTDCEGLSIMVETFQEKKINQIAESLEHIRAKHIDLIDWAENERDRNIFSIQTNSK